MEDLGALYNGVYSGRKLQDYTRIIIVATSILLFWEQFYFRVSYKEIG